MSNENTNMEILGQAHEYAGFWLRFVSALMDSVIILLITTPIVNAIYGEQYWGSTQLIVGPWDFIVTWIAPAIAVVWLWSWKQATPGKMAIKAIIVDDTTGNPPTMKQWIIRYLGYYLSLIPLGLGYLWVAWDPKKQGWHDKLAGTVVIRPKNKGVEAVTFTPPQT